VVQDKKAKDASIATGKPKQSAGELRLQKGELLLCRACLACLRLSLRSG
jgi:hypothetical protein